MVKQKKRAIAIAGGVVCLGLAAWLFLARFSSIGDPGVENSRSEADTSSSVAGDRAPPDGQTLPAAERHSTAPGFTVRIVDTLGRPIAGAHVGGLGASQAIADGNGCVAAGNSPERGTGLLVHHAGFAPAAWIVDDRMLEERRTTIVLKRASTLRGTVVDGRGTAIADADIVMQLGLDPDDTADTPSLSLDGEGRLVHVARAKSGPDGVFELSDLAAGTYMLEWSKDGYVSMKHLDDGSRVSNLRVEIGDETIRNETLTLCGVWVGAIEVTHRFGLDSDLLRWMLRIGISPPDWMEPMGGVFPELTSEFYQLVCHGRRPDAHVHPIVAIDLGSTADGTGADVCADYELGYLQDQSVCGAVRLVPLERAKRDPSSCTVEVRVGQSKVPLGRLRVVTPFPIDVVGRDPARFGVMQLGDRKTWAGSEELTVDLPCGTYFVAPSRFSMLDGSRRRQEFQIVEGGQTEIAMAGSDVGRVSIYVDDRNGRPLAAYNLKVRGGENAQMIAGRASNRPVVQFYEIGDTCSLELWDVGFTVMNELSFVVREPSHDVHLAPRVR